MTPAAVMAEIPDDLLRRHNNHSNQLYATKRLAQWLEQRGHRPTWAELLGERQRRAQ